MVLKRMYEITRGDIVRTASTVAQLYINRPDKTIVMSLNNLCQGAPDPKNETNGFSLT